MVENSAAGHVPPYFAIGTVVAAPGPVHGAAAFPTELLVDFVGNQN